MGFVQAQQFDIGMHHSIVICGDTSIWSCGWNGYGQLGDSSINDTIQPINVLTHLDVESVSIGAGHSLLLDKNADVWAFGYNSTQDSYSPVQVSGLTDIVDISAGINHGMALKSDGSVWLWGANSFRQLAKDSIEYDSIPSMLKDFRHVLAIDAGRHATSVITPDSALWTWGYNYYGKLGHPNLADTAFPAPFQIPCKIDPESPCQPGQAFFEASDSLLSVQFTDHSKFPQQWSWDFGDGYTDSIQHPLHIYDTSGTYEVCLTLTNNCNATTYCDSIEVICPLPKADFEIFIDSDPLTIALADSSEGASHWSWHFGDGTKDSIPEPVHTYALNGTYDVCLIVTNACGTDESCQDIRIQGDPVHPGLASTAKERSGLNIFPNPMQKDLWLSWPDHQPGKKKLLLQNALGQPVHIFELPADQTSGETLLDLSGLPAGIYWLIYSSKNKTSTVKLVKY